MYVLSPVLSGVFILLITALVFNNLSTHPRYPTNRKFTQTLKRYLFSHEQ